jgi:hypothetical protein
MSGYVSREAFARSREAFWQAERWAAGADAAGSGHAVLERELAVRGREIARLLLQDHLDARAAAEPRRARVTGPDGVARTRAGPGHARALASVPGPVRVTRIACRAPGVPNVRPADAELDLPAGKHSHGLAEMAASAAARGSLAAACAEVTARTGCALGTRQCQQLVRGAAADLAGFYASRPRPAAGPGEVLVLSCDGKGIRMRPGQLRPETVRKTRKSVPKQDGRLSRGEVRTRKRMAGTGAVSAITPVPRTVQDILGPGPVPRPAGPAGSAQVADLQHRRGRRRRDRRGLRRGQPPRPRPPADLDRTGRREYRPDPPHPGRGRRPGHRGPRHHRLHPRHRAPMGRRLVLLPPRPAPAPARGSGPAPPRSCTAAPPASPPPSAPPAAWARPGAPPRTRPRATSRPRPRTWTTPQPSRTGGPSPPASSRAPAATWSRTARTSPAPAGAWKPPRPSSSSAPSGPTATGTPTGPATSSASTNATTQPATLSPPDPLTPKERHPCGIVPAMAPRRPALPSRSATHSGRATPMSHCRGPVSARGGRPVGLAGRK